MLDILQRISHTVNSEKEKGRDIMGYYLNSDICYEAFKYIVQMEYFVDKSEVLNELIEVMNTENRFVCVTRPRRFGKTAVANLIASFFSKGCDSRELFEKLKINRHPEFDVHVNRHNVIAIDFSKMPFMCESYNEYIKSIVNKLMRDIIAQYPDCGISEYDSPWEALEVIRMKKNERFVFVLDEWDFIFHDETFEKKDHVKYLRFLQNLLKSQPYVELVYMTGILPIAKYSSGSSLNMFSEYTMADTSISRFGTCFGFTDSEVRGLYAKYTANTRSVSFEYDDLKEWYNGYQTTGGETVFNPRSVIYALMENHLGTYWSSTGPYDEIFFYISHNLHEVRSDIVRMVAGESIEISIKNFTAETLELHSREDIFSAMLVYGMLTFKDGKISIPNKELMQKYEEVLRKKEMGYIAALAKCSEEMLQATLNQDCETMIDILSTAHDTEIPILNYNNEADLGALVNLVYLSARDRYRIEREDRAGRGYADFIFYPYAQNDTAIILELKVDSTPQAAIRQIEDKKYALRFTQDNHCRCREILAVGISYDKKTKEHSCEVKVIE